jgi:hypothetical protein
MRIESVPLDAGAPRDLGERGMGRANAAVQFDCRRDNTLTRLPLRVGASAKAIRSLFGYTCVCTGS